MKSNEFIEKNPKLFKEAQNCKSLDEFLNLAKKNNIKFDDISLEEAYSLLNGQQEINDDMLDNVAGGRVKRKVTPPGYPTEEYPKSVDLSKNDLTPEAYYQ